MMFPHPTRGGGGDEPDEGHRGSGKRKREDENPPGGGDGRNLSAEDRAEIVARAAKRARDNAARRSDAPAARPTSGGGTAGYSTVDALRALAENRPLPQRTAEQQEVQEGHLRRMREISREQDRRAERLQAVFTRAFDYCREFDFTESAYRHFQPGRDFDQATYDFFSAWSPEGWLRDQPRDAFAVSPSDRNSGVDFTISFLPGGDPRRTITGNCDGDSVTVFHIGPVQ